jgi:HAD superfamily hydrolase (TIGR01509 family)
VGCDEVPRSKPAPDGVLEACRALGVEPSETILIGDSRFDEGAAKAAGVAFRWFTSFAELRLD